MAMAAAAGSAPAAVQMRGSCRGGLSWLAAAACLPVPASRHTAFTRLPATIGRGSRCCDRLAHPHSSLQHVCNTSSPPQQSEWPATAKVAAFTGAYITVFGAVALLAPQLVVAVLFPGRWANRVCMGKEKVV